MSTTQDRDGSRKDYPLNGTGTIVGDRAVSGASRDSGNIYVIIGASVGSGVVMVMLVVLAVVLIRRRRNRDDIEEGGKKADRTYDEIDEAGNQGIKKTKNKDKKEKKKKKQNREKKDQHSDGTAASSGADGIELTTMDTAPDIITAHDNESIYETLDSRRAALRAKAGHVAASGNQSKGLDAGYVTTGRQSGGFDSEAEEVPGCRFPLAQDGVVDPTYDHLGRFKNPRFPAVPEKRLTDPVVAVRTEGLRVEPRAFHSADLALNQQLTSVKVEELAVWDQAMALAGAAGEDQPPSGTSANANGSLRSSLTEEARHSASGGRRLLCQLTMVGVLENGRPVPVRPAAATNTYFILEPSGEADAEEEEEAGDLSRGPRFRIRGEGEGERGGEGETNSGTASATGAGAGGEYFILEPMEGQKEEEGELEPEPGTILDSQPLPPGHLHHGQGPSTTTTPADLSGTTTEAMDEADDPQGVQYKRVSSCPGQCPPCTNGASSGKSPSYNRSLSSPQRRRRGADREEFSPPVKKMDSDVLKARIRREMIALGFLDNDDGNDTAAAGGGGVQRSPHDCSGSPSSPCREIPTGNNYFILEPQQDGHEEREEKEDEKENASEIRAPDRRRFQQHQQGEVKPRYHHRPQPPLPPTSPSSPPPLPKRNKHGRSKSETPPLARSGRSASATETNPEDQGPVVVSLSKLNQSRSLSTDHEPQDNHHLEDGHDEAFRGRLKSEPTRGFGKRRRRDV